METWFIAAAIVVLLLAIIGCYVIVLGDNIDTPTPVLWVARCVVAAVSLFFLLYFVVLIHDLIS